MWDKRAKLVSLYDGDTLTVILDQGFGDTKQIRVRLFGVFAPELRQLGGVETRLFVQEWLTLHTSSLVEWPFIITTIRLKNDTREVTTLERYVAVLTSVGTNDNLNGAISEFVRARGYAGGVGA